MSKHESMTGKVLSNGATIRNLYEDMGGGVVLASKPNGDSLEFITWAFRPGDLSSTYWGHYFDNDLVAARTDYIIRVAEHIGVTRRMICDAIEQ